MKVKVYISGPISGATTYPQSFKKASEYLLHLGNEVVDPSMIDSPFGRQTQGTTWDYYMRAGIKLLMGCDRIYMLEGWEDSEGAMLEHMIASRLNIPCLYEVEDVERV